MITVSEETAVDYDLTARIATEAFASTDVSFSADRIKWLYEEGFGQGTIVLAAMEDGRKVGQIALVGQKLHLDGEVRRAVQLVDLFVLKPYRSAQLLRQIFRKVEEVCEQRGISCVLALPNDKSVQLNARFLKLKPLMKLPIRAGVSLRQPRKDIIVYSGYVKSMARDEALRLLSAFVPPDENGLAWESDALLGRLNDPTRDYALHATADLLLISSSRRTRGVKHTLLCGFLARPKAELHRGEVEELVRAACRFQRLPIFVYAGINERLPNLPGTALTSRLRRPILVQFRDLANDAHAARFDRFQLIDSDFA